MYSVISKLETRLMLNILKLFVQVFQCFACTALYPEFPDSFRPIDPIHFGPDIFNSFSCFFVNFLGVGNHTYPGYRISSRFKDTISSHDHVNITIFNLLFRFLHITISLNYILILFLMKTIYILQFKKSTLFSNKSLTCCFTD